MAKKQDGQRDDEHDDGQDGEEVEIKKQILVLIPSWVVSLVVHSVLLLILMSFTLSPPQPDAVELLSYAEEVQEIEEITAVQFEVIEELEIEEPMAKAEAIELVSDVVSYQIPVADALPEAASMASDFEAFDSMFAEGELIDIGPMVGEGEALFRYQSGRSPNHIHCGQLEQHDWWQTGDCAGRVARID